MKKANLFNAEKRMSERVENFMYCIIWKEVINKRYKIERDKLEAKLRFNSIFLLKHRLMKSENWHKITLMLFRKNWLHL